MTKKILIVLFAAFVLALPHKSQAWGGGLVLGTESYFSFGVMGSYGGLMFNGSIYDPSKMGFTYGLNIGYTCYINNNIGFATGVHINRMSSGYYEKGIRSAGKGKISISGLTSGWTTAPFILETDRTDEIYKTVFIEVPIMLAMQFRKWYWDIGLKIAVPVSMKAEYIYGESELYIDKGAQMGTGVVLDEPMYISTYDGIKGSINIYDEQRHQLLMFFVTASAEVGYNVAFYGGASSLSVGLFFDFALNTAELKGISQSALELNTDEIKYSSSMESEHTTSMGCFKTGLRLQYNLGIGQGARRNTRAMKFL